MKIKELLRNFWYYNLLRSTNKELIELGLEVGSLIKKFVKYFVKMPLSKLLNLNTDVSVIEHCFLVSIKI